MVLTIYNVIKELAIIHTVGNAVKQANSRSDLLEKRVEFRRFWYGFLGRELGR